MPAMYYWYEHGLRYIPCYLDIIIHFVILMIPQIIVLFEYVYTTISWSSTITVQKKKDDGCTGLRRDASWAVTGNNLESFMTDVGLTVMVQLVQTVD